jgi:probable F420-dependent oxidoreductase
MNIGRFGIWSSGLRDEDPGAAGEIRDAAAELEELGYGAIWLGSSPGVRHAAPLLDATSAIVVATGILNIWEHDPADVVRQQADLETRHPGRFVLGLGASHALLVPGYRKPYSAMVSFLDGLDAAGGKADARVLAALGPRMLALSRDRTAGAHPYLITPEHTAKAREILGAGPLLAPELKVVLEEDSERARSAARSHLAIYLGMPNYTGNLRRLGFGDDDFRDGGSDRLIDATFAWGDLATVRARAAAHHDAGADQVVLQVVTADNVALPRSQWRELADGLGLRR